MLHVSGMTYQDLLAIEPQAEQSVWFASGMTEAFARILEQGGEARTMRDGNGAILCCCGAIPLTPHLAHAWTLLSVHASPHMHGIIKEVRRLMDEEMPHRRLEMNIRSGFGHGHRWARLLGFACEGVMRCYGADGEDHHLYARIRI